MFVQFINSEIITCACYIQVDPISRYKNFWVWRGMVLRKKDSERLSHASKKAIGHLACKAPCLFDRHEHKVFAFARFGMIFTPN